MPPPRPSRCGFDRDVASARNSGARHLHLIAISDVKILACAASDVRKHRQRGGGEIRLGARRGHGDPVGR